MLKKKMYLIKIKGEKNGYWINDFKEEGNFIIFLSVSLKGKKTVHKVPITSIQEIIDDESVIDRNITECQNASEP